MLSYSNALAWSYPVVEITVSYYMRRFTMRRTSGLGERHLIDV